jgi:hypothetical protein
MKSLTLSAFLTLIIFVSSCKKNNDGQAIMNPASSLVKTIIISDTTGQFNASMTLQYDSQGKLVQMVTYNPPSNDTLIYKYEYYPSMVIEKIFYTNNDKYGRNLYTLNSAGLAISETDMGYGQGGDSSIAATLTYKYNTEGYMIEKKSYLFGDTATWYSLNWQIQNGNNASMALTLSTWGGVSVMESYEYNPNSVNTMGNSNTGMLFFGKSNTNLVKSASTNSTPPQTGIYSYSFDSMNRVIKEFIRGSGLTSGSSNIIITYY